MAKVDKHVAYKILYMSLATHAKQKLWSHNKEVFEKEALARYNSLGRIAEHLEWDERFNIFWQTCGMYVLQPPMLAHTVPSEHQYTGVQCRFLEADIATVAGASAHPHPDSNVEAMPKFRMR